MDVSGYDQCAIVLRYVFEKEVKEKLIGVKSVQSTTGESLLKTLLSIFQINELKVENCIANAFDGASNMNGEYNGVSAKLKDLVPNHIHTWCYAHVLNLVISDVAQCLPEAISFFGLLQETQVFIKESCKRLNVYKKQNPKICLTAIGNTRWRSKSDGATKIYGSSAYWFSDTEETRPPNVIYPDLVVALSVISNSKEFNSKTRYEANALLSKFLSFETVLVSMTFLKIFSSTTPLSDYLQTTNLDFAQAWSFVATVQKTLKKNRNEFDKVVKAANKFVSFMTLAIEEKINKDPSLDAEKLCIQTELPQKRIRPVKKVHGESVEDAFINSSVEEKFKIKVFYKLMDKINQSMNMRFSDQKDLYLDLACFDPRRFPLLKKDGIPNNALDKICSLIGDIDNAKLKEELISLINVWPEIKSKFHEQYEMQLESSNNESEASNTEVSEDEGKGPCNLGEKCNVCIKCVYTIIFDYNMYSVLYTQLYKVYKYLLTIPLTQVSCERAFSNLKLIKTRLRSTLSQSNLESFLMMQIEREKVTAIDNDLIVRELCQQSSEMKRLLEF